MPRTVPGSRVKVLYTDQSSGELRRVGREVRAAQRVASFCTARILQAHLEGPSPFIVSEYVEGVSLGRAVRDGGRFCGDDLHRLAVGIATALTAVHEAGVVHRDLKPDNVLLGPDGPRVIDFGVARTVEMSVSAPGALAGTPRYMAPEVVGMQPAGAPADVFAWGAVVLFAATGEHAFGGQGIAAVLHQVLTAHPDVSKLPASLRALVGAALAKDPLARPSARTIVSALTCAPTAGPQALLAAGSAQAGLLARGEPIDPTLSAVAEAAYTALTGREQALVPEVLLRLVVIGEDGGVSTRAVPRDELCDPDDREAVEAVLAAFGALLVRTGGQVELARPAVVRAWPRLRGWLDAHRGSLPVHHRIRQAAQDWQRYGHRRADVLTGRRLEEALMWVTAGRPPALNQVERAFLDAGTRAHTRATRRRRALTAALAILVVLASGAAVSATGAQRQAVRAQRESDRQRDIAISGQLITKSQELGGTDPTLSQRLSVAAWRLQPSAEARHAMLAAATHPLTAILTGHTNWVRSVAFSPDGATLATGGDDHTVRLWDVATRRQTASLPGLAAGVWAVAFSPDGHILATGTDDETVRLWDVATRRQTATFRSHHGRTFSLAFSPDGRTLATSGNDRTVRLWDVTGRRRAGAPLTGHGDMVGSVEYSPDGRTLAAGTPLGVRLWDVTARPSAGTPLADLPHAAGPVAFSPDGRILATEGGGGTVRLWDVATRRPTATLPGHTEGVFSVVFSPDSRVLATGGLDQTVRLWDVAARRPIGPALTGHTGPVGSMAFSPDGRTLATACDDQTVRLWDLTARHPIILPKPRLSQRDSLRVSSAALSPDGRTLALGGDDETVRLWDVATRRPVGALTGHTGPVSSVAFSPDGRMLAAGGFRVVRLWNVATRRHVDISVPEPGDQLARRVSSTAFSPDGRILATGGVTAHLWDVATHRRIGSVPIGKLAWQSLVAFSPDGHTLVTGSDMGMVRLWDVATRRLVGTPLPGHTSPARTAVFSPDGRILAIGGEDHTVRLWDVAARYPIGTPLTGHTDQVWSMAFSPDGRVLATGGDDRTIRLWDVATRRPIGAPLHGHTGRVKAVAFSRDGRTLATGSDNAATAQWEVDYLTDVVSWLCSRARGSLTRQEWARHVPAGPAYRRICP